MFHLDPTGLLSLSEVDTKKTVHLSLSGQRLALVDRNILVYHKKKFEIMPLKNFSEGMTTFFVFERKEISFDTIDKQALVDGIHIHQIFSEETGKFSTTLPASRLAGIQKILMAHKISVSTPPTRKEIENRIRKNSEEKNLGYFLSFLVGTALTFGKHSIVKNCLTNVKIFLPLSANLAGKENLFQEIFSNFFEQGIFITSDLIQEKLSSLYQLSINDPELLSLYAHVVKPLENITQISTLEKQKNFVSEIKLFLKDKLDQTEYAQFLKIVDKGVLKFWEKR